MEPVSKIAKWLREWADKDLACAPATAPGSLGYIAARMLETQERSVSVQRRINNILIDQNKSLLEQNRGIWMDAIRYQWLKSDELDALVDRKLGLQLKES